jgi:hypothetical protein
MNLSDFACRALSVTENFTKKHGPELLTGAGIVGFGATTYLVGRAVLKSQPVIGQLKDDTNRVSAKELDENYSKQDQAKEMGQLWIRRSMIMAKIYSPAAATGALSVVCILSAHGIMRQRQTALVAAYATLDAGFRAYRKRVEEEVGADKELDLYRGVRERRIEEENGEKVIVTGYDENTPSPYSKFFDESSPNWSKTPEYNLFFLRSQQNHANDRLRVNGFVFLNEVYEALGLPRTQAGQVVGWKLDTEEGDGHVDFGLYAIGDENNRAFVNGLEGSVLLDFNVDGPIRI